MSIILNMIVKNEERVLQRCLNSVAPFIDSWVIADTGSTDSTKTILESFKAIKPGIICDIPWTDYGTARTEALWLAQQNATPVDYLFFIDADETFHAPESWSFPELTEPCYEIALHHGILSYLRPGLVKANLLWKWIDPVHEYLALNGMAPPGIPIYAIYKQTHPETETENGKVKFMGHAQIYLNELAKDPENGRYWFYLGQSYRDAKMLDLSLGAYEKRAAMEGWSEETYIAKLNVARIKNWLGRTSNEVICAFMEAHSSRPTRMEALGELAKHLRLQGLYGTAVIFAEAALDLEPSRDKLFVESDWYNWRLEDEFSISAFYIGRYKDALDTCDRLLERGTLPFSELARVRVNREFCVKALNGNNRNI